jgi:polysaccharide biosynthesis transport protein
LLRISVRLPPKGELSVLSGETTLEKAVHRDAQSNLHVLTARPDERSGKVIAADILAAEAFRRLVDELRQKYDLVILDSPPTLAVTDARIIAALADMVVFAVRWDDTPRAAVLSGLKELLSVRAPVAGLALTLVGETRSSRYAYRGYGYRAGYRRYYRD